MAFSQESQGKGDLFLPALCLASRALPVVRRPIESPAKAGSTPAEEGVCPRAEQALGSSSQVPWSFPYSRPFNPLTDGPLITLITMCKGENLLGLGWKRERDFILSRLKVESLI